MPVPMLDLTPQHAPHLSEFRDAFERLLETGRFVLGPEVEGFEQDLAGYCHAQHAVGVSSGTDALILGLMTLGVGAGDEVVTTPFTFFATAGSIARVGAKPVFVDIDPDTFNLDPSKLEHALTPKTRVVIPVHLYGQCADMQPILRITRDRGLRVIEDAAQAIGATDNTQSAGSIGDIGCLSFYPTKNLSAFGDAGACLTNDDQLNQQLRVLRVHGQSDRYHHTAVGGNFRIDAIQAMMLHIKLRSLEAWTARRQEIAKTYDRLLEDSPVIVPKVSPGKRHVYHQYVIRVPEGRRDALRKHLTDRGIGCEVYYPVPLHRQEAFSSLGYREGDFPLAEQAAREVLGLPIYPGLSSDQQEQVATTIREYYQ